MKKFFFFFISIFISFSYQINSQCLNTVSTDSNQGGYFDTSGGSWLSTHWYSTGTEGTISHDTDDFYYGTGSLKVDVSSTDDYKNDKVRIWTKSSPCGLTIQNSQDWNVSFYIKGEIGNVVEFKLIDSESSYSTSIGDASYTIAYNGWHYMRLKIVTTGAASSSGGKLRINFQSTGTYRLDNIVLEQESTFNNWYVSDSNGNNNNSGTDPNNPFKTLRKATISNSNYNGGDIVNVMTGTYYNSNWDGDNNGTSDNNNAYISISSSNVADNNGSVNRPIVIRNYIDSNGTHQTPTIRFDGSAGFSLGTAANPISHAEIAGFTIIGPAASITYSEASSYRTSAVNETYSTTPPNEDNVNKFNIYHGRGILSWGASYLNIHNNNVSYCPNSGIRVNNGDFIRISNNTVHKNTWWSYNAESGIVLAQSKNISGSGTDNAVIKMRITNNTSYQNINKLPYFNPGYSTNGNCSGGQSDTSYGCGSFNKIIDGSGCYITRNNYTGSGESDDNPNGATYYGTFLFSNNVSYGNGINGVVVHKTDNSIVANNTVYKNGEVPGVGDTEWSSADGNHSYDDDGPDNIANNDDDEEWKNAIGSLESGTYVGRQQYSGIVVHTSTNVNVYNNISWARNSADYAYVETGGTSPTINWINNLGDTVSNLQNGGVTDANTTKGQNQTITNLTQGNPSFTDENNFDFTLQVGSPAIDAGNSTYAPGNDNNFLSRPQGNNYDIGAFEHRNTWTGSTSTDWNTTSNWSTGDVPIEGKSPIIANVTNQPIISNNDGASNNGDVKIKDLTVNSGAELTINKDAYLTLGGDFTNNSGTVTLNSDSDQFSSIIVHGSSSGNITYNRYVNSLSGGSGWDLIGSPVNGLQISSFATTNDSPLATGNGSGAGDVGEYAIGTYDPSNNTWSNYTTSNVSTTQFTPGKGYQMATDSGATMAFTGTIDTNATETIAIESFTDASGRRWNLISNPYPSFITIGPNSTSNTFLEVNDDVIDASYVGVYGYDADNSNGSNYTIHNNTSSSKIAPGQGFFVAARGTDAANITFKEEMQTTSTGDDFISGDNMENTEVVLRIYNDGNAVGNTKLYFGNDLTLALDPGWDAGSYSQSASIMTRLVEEDEGYGMAINAMGLDAMENVVIPLVINQSAGQEFRINLHTATIPDPNLYLEDIEEGTFTNLYEGDFVYAPTSDLSGVGRFFLHMTADTMSNGEVSTSMLNAYKEIDANYITVEGLATQPNETKVSLYNILGSEVLSTTLQNNMGIQKISTIGMATGIYIIELESVNDRLTKKLIIH